MVLLKKLAMKKSIITILGLVAIQIQAQTINIKGPEGSGQFGKTVTVLTNGNYVVTDPLYDDGGFVDVGAVYLYNGSTHALISTLKGSTANDQVGNAGVTALSNSNFVVSSTYWTNGTAVKAGAVTWGNGISGVSGVVSSSNSLVGSTTNDQVGSGGITVFANSGNYLVFSTSWDNGMATDAGAVTWGSGISGVSGVLSSSNSLVGSTTNDQVGISKITILNNDNYLVISPTWQNGSASNAGAVTWGNGSTGVTGIVSNNNSIVGSTIDDRVGNGGVTGLSNGNYVVNSPNWSNGTLTNAGAVTWANGLTGLSGEINSSNSLVGDNADDNVGYIGTTALTNGNYVVSSINCHNGTIVNAGAATWTNGNTGISGFINISNSLVGGAAKDGVGSKIIALNNGNYVVCSPNWDNGAVVNAGAATWADGTTGKQGLINAGNSLVGIKANDYVGTGATALSNGYYVVQSPNWDNGSIVDAGAATWCNGTISTTGNITSSNSLVGGHINDHVGNAITSVGRNNACNYVVSSPNWTNGNATDAGAVTWCGGYFGKTGYITDYNSLVGTISNDYVGMFGVTPLSNGDYVVNSAYCNIGGVAQAGAITLGLGMSGITGNVSINNSLVGSHSYDFENFGIKNIIPLNNGNYIVANPYWDNGSKVDAGAVTYGYWGEQIHSEINSTNSLMGETAHDNIGGARPFSGIELLSNGDYVIQSPFLRNGVVVGAVTWGNRTSRIAGTIMDCNSIIGTSTPPPALFGSLLDCSYNDINTYFIVGRPADNTVIICKPTNTALLPNSPETIMAIVDGINPIPFITSDGCHIIATLTPNGTSPAEGITEVKIWIESTVPTYLGVPFVARHYQITPTENAGTATAAVTLYFTQQEFDDFNNHEGSILNLPTDGGDASGKANLRICKYPGRSNNGNNGNGFPGTYLGTPELIDPDDADIVWNSNLNRWEVSFDVTGFSGFIVQTKPAIIIPVQLLNFSAALSKNDILVRWNVTNEINAKNFEVERSTDGRNFITVGTVAANNTSGEHSYTYTDAGSALLNTSTLYYRLKQTDMDGRYSNSQTVVLHLTKGNSIAVYPNPVTNITTLSFSNAALLGTPAVLTDMLGKRVKQIIISNYHQRVDMSNLSNGVYLLKLTDGSIVKLIKN